MRRFAAALVLAVAVALDATGHHASLADAEAMARHASAAVTLAAVAAGKARS